MKPILIDLSFVSKETVTTSIPIVIFRLLSGVKTSDRKNIKILFDKDNSEFLHSLLPDYDYLTIKMYHNRKHGFDLRLLSIPFRYKRIVDKSGCSAVFCPSDGNVYSIFKPNIPEIVEINDLKRLKKDFGGYDISSGLWHKLTFLINKRSYSRIVHRAKLIFTISDYTKKDLIAYFPTLDKKKISILYPSLSLSNNSKRPSSLQIDGDYILDVNTITPSKNTLTLVKAYKHLSERDSYFLVLVGRATGYWDKTIVPYLKAHQLEEKVVLLENLSDEEMRYVYDNASLFVTPSLHEGFGFTPLEAAICEVPVICSKCESLPEVTQGLVHYYESAEDEKALANVIHDVLTNKPDKIELKTIAKRYSESYSPIVQAERFMDIVRGRFGQ